MTTVKRQGVTQKHISTSDCRVTATIGHYELKILDGATVTVGDKKTTFKMWQGRRLYVNMYRRGKRVFAAHFEVGKCTDRAWYLRAEEFITNGDAQEFSSILRAAMPRLVIR